MKQFAFISRHTITTEQHKLAAEHDIKLVPIGDLNEFNVTTAMIDAFGPFDGVVVEHPAAAMRLSRDFEIGVFENENRAPIGERPQFHPVALHIYP